MVSILNILGISIIIYILYATQAVWIGWVNVLFNIIKPFFIGLVIAYVLSPLVSFFEKHHFKRSFAIGFVFIIFITFILTLIGTLLPLFYKNITELTNTFTMGIMELEKIIHKVFNIDLFNYIVQLMDFIQQWQWIDPNSIVDTSISVVTQAVTTIGNIIIYIVLSIYFLADYENVKKRIKKLAGVISPSLPVYLKRIDEGLIEYIKAFITLACIQGGLYGGMYLILGHPNWFTLGLLSGVSGIFPYIGPITANIFGFITTLGLGTVKIVLLMIIIFILSNLDSYYITPKIYSESIKIKSIWELFGILTGLTLFGPLGIVIAMPLLVICKITFETYHHRHKSTYKN